LEPIVNLVVELDEGSGGHDSKYGSIDSITWEYKNRSHRDDPYLWIGVTIENWTFWNGEQLDNFMEKVREFADEHGNIEDQIFYIKKDKPLKFSLEIPLDKHKRSNEQK
jgi:hypothetical protein